MIHSSFVEMHCPDVVFVALSTSMATTFLRFCQTKVDTALQSLPEKPRGGTWAKLKSTIRLKLFGRSGGKTVFHLLPLEETLRDAIII